MQKETDNHQGWSVKQNIDTFGNVRLVVCKRGSRIDDHGYTIPIDIEDLSIFVPHEAPWWQFWAKPFRDRVIDASQRAKRRAWELNSQVSLAVQVTYDIEHNRNG